jgi:hypothetical protein
MKRVVLAVGGVLVAVLAIDVMKLTRASGLSAVSCMPMLLEKTFSAEEVLSLTRDTIVRQSEIHELPSALVAAVLVDHQRQLTRSRVFTDCFGSALGANLSLGPAQVRVGTAAKLDGMSLSSLSPAEFRALRAELLNPESNISYEARELRALLERTNRFPGMSASSLMNSPAAMALVITEYRSGRMSTSVEESRIGANAVRTLNIVLDDMLTPFLNSEDDPARIRAEISAYLDNIACETGMFNRACMRDPGLEPPRLSNLDAGL